MHCLKVISTAVLPADDFCAFKNVPANKYTVNDVIQTTTTKGQNSAVNENVLTILWSPWKLVYSFVDMSQRQAVTDHLQRFLKL